MPSVTKVYILSVIMLSVLALTDIDKHSSFLQYGINYGRKKCFVAQAPGPRSCDGKLFQ
jgi:hypothetical protein